MCLFQKKNANNDNLKLTAWLHSSFNVRWRKTEIEIPLPIVGLMQETVFTILLFYFHFL